MKMLSLLLAILLTFCQEAAPESREQGLERYIAYIGQTGEEIRESLDCGPEDWNFYEDIAGGLFFRLEGQDYLFGFSGEEMDYGDSPDGVRCVEVSILLPVSELDKEIGALEEQLGVCFEYNEEFNSYFAADLERRLMFYLDWWRDGPTEGEPWLQILHMNDENYAALQRIAEQKG